MPGDGCNVGRLLHPPGTARSEPGERTAGGRLGGAPRWWNGRHTGLKTWSRQACGFESHPWHPGLVGVPGRGRHRPASDRTDSPRGGPLRPLRILHTADLHLDSPLRGVAERDDRLARKVEAATFETAERIFSRAEDEAVDLVLVAGDVFDEETRSLKARLWFRARLERLAARGIRSFVVFGNHDHAGLWSGFGAFAPGVHVFPGDRVGTVELDLEGVGPVRIHGRSYPRREVRENLVTEFPEARGGALEIGLLHANVGGAEGHEAYAPCGIEDLAAKGYDFWALGHVHRRTVLRDAGPLVVYPGNPQGRHAGERGPRGFAWIELGGGRPAAVRFEDADTVRFDELGIDLTGVSTLVELADLSARVLEVARVEGPEVLALRLRLEGATPLDHLLRRPGALDELSESLVSGVPGIVLLGIRLRTRPPESREELAEGEGFVSELVRERDRLRSDPEAVAELSAVLDELWADPRYRRVLEPPSPGLVSDWLDEAEGCLLDRLRPEPP